MKRAPARRTLVIGGLGFIGANLTARLLQDGAAVTILTPSKERHPDEARAFELAGASIVEGDIRDSLTVSRAVESQEVVFNLSGQSGAVQSMADPWTDFDVNCRGTLVLLEALRSRNRAATLVFAGSRLQYGRPTQLPAGEADAGEALCLHAIHKRTAEGYLRLYGQLFGLRFAVARLTNPYGPGQPSGRIAYGVINRWIHLALADGSLPVYGDGSQQRDYVHVDDVVEALLVLVANASVEGRVYNVGSGTGTRMVDAAQAIIDVVGGGRIQHVDWPPLAAGIETGDFVADVSKIARELGWRPSIGLAAGLERTANHYRARVTS